MLAQSRRTSSSKIIAGAIIMFYIISMVTVLSSISRINNLPDLDIQTNGILEEVTGSRFFQTRTSRALDVDEEKDASVANADLATSKNETKEFTLVTSPYESLEPKKREPAEREREREHGHGHEREPTILEEEPKDIIHKEPPFETNATVTSPHESKPKKPKREAGAGVEAEAEAEPTILEEETKEIINKEVPVETNATATSPHQPAQEEAEPQLDEHSTTPPEPYRRWAYAFLVGGCNKKNNDYTGFIANVAVSAKVLQDNNSTADVVLLIQMSHDSDDETLSDDDDEMKILSTLPNIKIRYIPRFSSGIHQNFYSLMMEKFRILDLAEYSRVVFLDSDVMPYTSLDYLFDLSEPGEQPGSNKTSAEVPAPAATKFLMENIILEKSDEASHGGLFLLKPNHNDYLRAMQIITETEKRALDLPFPHFDPVVGFGQPMWEEWGRVRNEDEPPRTNWTWHGSFADQGFLYHWVKYEKKSFSAIVVPWRNAVVNYSPVDGRAQNVSVFQSDYEGKGIFGKRCAPTCDLMHFTGRKKPWQLGRNHSNWRPRNFYRPIRMWYAVLNELERIANVTLEFKLGRHTAPIGSYPSYHDRINHIKHKAANNWTMYA